MYKSIKANVVYVKQLLSLYNIVNVTGMSVCPDVFVTSFALSILHAVCRQRCPQSLTKLQMSVVCVLTDVDI